MTDKFIKGSNNNIIYVTSCCTNRCVMCCQPPLEDDDSSCHYTRNLILIDTADPETDYVCITGGEPTLSGELLFEYMHRIWNKMPNSTVHLLTNGRSFANASYTERFTKEANGKLVVGIPLHSDNYADHDAIAGAKGSFYETLKGLHNLGILGFEIELRVIILRQNYKRLDKIAEFITRNLPFVAQVSFMGLEVIGYAERNYSKVWVDSDSFTINLVKAISILDNSHIQTRIFNVPHCLLPTALWPFACKSISEWKKTNLRICNKCSVKNKCCGLFSTSKKYSANLRPISCQ